MLTFHDNNDHAVVVINDIPHHLDEKSIISAYCQCSDLIDEGYTGDALVVLGETQVILDPFEWIKLYNGSERYMQTNQQVTYH